MVTRSIEENPYESCEWPRGALEQFYSRKWLFKAEQMVLEKCGSELSEWSMLDIGVGTGRTTSYFASRVARYVGIDFNDSMLEACRRDFPDLAENLIRCDARSMAAFPDRCFDFVLFSFNGLDYLSPQDRLKALREIQRVGKKGASFLFSSHNLNSVDRILDFRSKLSKNPRRLIAGLWRFALLTLMNKSARALKSRDFAMFYDPYEFHTRLSWFLLSLRKHIGPVYCIKPDAQIRQLHSLGFSQVEVFDEAGREIVSSTELANLRDITIHYRCRI